MKVKIIIDDNIIIDEEISDKFSNFTINEGDFKLEYSKNNVCKSNLKPNEDERKKSKETTNMSGEELAELFSDLFVEDTPKPKPILIGEDEIDEITEELEDLFRQEGL